MRAISSSDSFGIGSKASILAAAAGIISSAWAPAARADVTEFALTRFSFYIQESDTPPITGRYWLFRAIVVTDTDFESAGSTVSFERPPTVTMNPIESVPTQYYADSAYYSDEAEFLTDYPETAYTFTVDEGGAPVSAALVLPAELYCAEIPALTGDAFTRLQSFDPAADFDGTINGFTPVAGSALASTNLDVIRNGDGYVTWHVTLEPGETAFHIPAGTLLASSDYSIRITYDNQIWTPGAGFANATSILDFSRGTNASFSTIRNCSHFVDTMTVSAQCTEAGQLCGNTVDIAVDTCGLLMAEYITSAGHCSDVGMNYTVDGILVATTATAGPGQSTGLIDLGPVSPGVHQITLEAFGVEGGCNSGFLQGWGGTLNLHRCGSPVTLTGPDAATICPGDTATFTVTAEGVSPLTYQWSAADPSAPDVFNVLSDGPIAGVGTISGSATASLTVADATVTGLLFQAQVLNGCSSATSTPAALTIGSCSACPADFNGDGVLNSDDLSDFITGYFNIPADPATDFNADGIINADDLGDFITAYFNGC